MIAYVLLRVFLLLLLVAANAFFAAAEFSLVSVRDTRIQQLIDARRIGARIVQKLHRNLDEVVNGVQLGVTIVSLTLGWVGEPLLAQMMLGPVQDLPHASVYAHGIAIVISFVLITFLHVILGELVPKSLALQRAEQVALAVAAPMDVFLTLTRPLLFVMSRAAGWVLRIFGSRRIRQGPVHSPDELKLIVTASRQVGEIPPFQEEMIHKALELDNITVREVMVPRPDIFSLPGDLTLSDALGRVVEEQHSRIPVYDPQRGPEHIIGVLYAKDLMRWTRLRLTATPDQPVAARVSAMRISQIMHDVLVVPETKVLTELLEEFKERKRHLAVVVDEFGSTAGVITVEDVLEQIVGEIEDEFDVAPPQQDLVEGEIAIVLEGSASIRDLESQYQLLLPRDSGFETLAGFILARLQKIPRQGESFDFEGHRYTVQELEGHRIAKVKIEKLAPKAVSQSAY
ncbi:MAG TPA: hemolysin family protein [Terriglobales bacterium]|jgi:putative hemolysin|nr:hemolysin family protein [Terriglobales bacterium]